VSSTIRRLHLARNNNSNNNIIERVREIIMRFECDVNPIVSIIVNARFDVCVMFYWWKYVNPVRRTMGPRCDSGRHLRSSIVLPLALGSKQFFFFFFTTIVQYNTYACYNKVYLRQQSVTLSAARAPSSYRYYYRCVCCRSIITIIIIFIIVIIVMSLSAKWVGVTWSVAIISQRETHPPDRVRCKWRKNGRVVVKRKEKMEINKNEERKKKRENRQMYVHNTCTSFDTKARSATRGRSSAARTSTRKSTSREKTFCGRLWGERGGCIDSTPRHLYYYVLVSTRACSPDDRTSGPDYDRNMRGLLLLVWPFYKKKKKHFYFFRFSHL
jgi:hypothetical protein